MATAAEQFGRILQVGPSLSVRGGVSSVERLIIEHVGSTLAIQHIPTMEEGTVWHKCRVFGRALRMLYAALHSREPVVVHIHFASRGSTLRKVILAWMTVRAHRPLILHAHGGRFNEFFGRLPSLAQLLVQRLFARADCVFVLSTQWRDFYTQHFGLPARRVMILHNPTALPEHVPARAGRTRVQFLFLGRIRERKGAFDALRAFKELPAPLRQRARLVFAGDGDIEALRERIRGCDGDVDVRGWIDAAQRDALLIESDVFVLPSYYEGVPMAMLEAMAYGLPVIATSVGGIPDVVADQCEGLIVAPGDIESLQGALRTMIEDESRRLTWGRYARSRAESFDVGRYSADLIRIYRRLLAVRH